MDEGWGIHIPGLEGGVCGEVAGGVLLGWSEDASAPLLVAALGRSPGQARRRRHVSSVLGLETLAWLAASFVVVAGWMVQTRTMRSGRG